MKVFAQKKKTMVIWTEAGRKVGMGHLSRCLVIARQLRKKAIDVKFLINDDLASIKWIIHSGFKYKIAALNKNHCQKAAQVNTGAVLIDTKRPIASLLTNLKQKGYKTILLDNFTAARLRADIVIFPSLPSDNGLSWNGFRGKVFGGAKFIPVAESYVKARQKARRLKLKPPYQILITMGGSDPNRLTIKVISALLKIKEPLNIKAVLGPAFSSDPDLIEIKKRKYPNIQFIKNTRDLSGAMANSHVAITALGITISELAVVGVPAIIIANFRSDLQDIEFYKKLGVNAPLDYYKKVAPSDIKNAVMNLISKPKNWDEIRGKAYRIITGSGAERIARIINSLT